MEIWALLKQPLPALITEIVHGAIRDVPQEVERQAQAHAVAIALTVAPGGLRLTVSDDGLGTSADAYEANLSGRGMPLRSTAYTQAARHPTGELILDAAAGIRLIPGTGQSPPTIPQPSDLQLQLLDLLDIDPRDLR
ncbi:hypothetical protein [Nonomuraea sp. 10N515B]|uniref:hypothetical protein n=1 Tax=Nonomuraea sp. 10N515B TaxID=3457422 RepID=UPI003FCC53B0